MSQRQFFSNTEVRNRSAVQSNNYELLAVPEAVSPHTNISSRSSGQFQLFTAPCMSHMQSYPIKSEEHHFHLVLASQGRVSRCKAGPNRESLEGGSPFIQILLHTYFAISSQFFEMSIVCLFIQLKILFISFLVP